MRETRILLIGKSGRLDCLAEMLHRSDRPKKILILSEVDNSSLRDKADVEVGTTDEPSFVEKWARHFQPDFAVIGPEEPLAAGIVDRLAEMRIPSVGPRQELAKLETSKSFTRALISRHGIPGNPFHRVFTTLDGVREFLQQLGTFVIKPDGLTGGKGVKVFGDHLSSIAEGYDYCAELLASSNGPLVIEERLDGEEFSLQSFWDGRNIVHTPPVQDHKRAYEGDQGPNTGGMGSYSCADHSLPFLKAEHLAEAQEINRQVGSALGQHYKGILYGGFILTRAGLRVIEYNARFGDPEVMNVLPLMQADFIEVCEAIISGTLNKLSITFEPKATVCKYVVPSGYPSSSSAGEGINVDAVRAMPGFNSNLRMYLAAVEEKSSELRLTRSRAVALVGIGDTLLEAEQIAERAASAVVGPVFHRTDIGTAELVRRRVDHLRSMSLESHRRRVAV